MSDADSGSHAAPRPTRGNAPGAVRVLIVGDDALGRAGLAAVLAGRQGLAVVAEHRREDDLAAALQAAAADVVVWDAGLGRPASLARLAPVAEGGLPVLALLAAAEDAPEALGAGARGVLLREAGAARLAAGVRAVASGLVVLDEALLPFLGRAGGGAAASLAEPFTPRELEVLQLLPLGLTNRAIAARLGISEHTAKFHVNAILGKLGAQTRAEAVAQAARLGLIVL
ncbi:MAG: response regulator transcription factor [Candidatus Lambdaproteobacteria bacterium]|nr:response regulator transcription factor [Candidatus Lambdaproteobacteria bacterium]